jgi:hypothetical protein
MDMHAVTDSSMFSHHGYHDETGEMHLTFKNGGDTHAYPVSKEKYEEFKSSSSLGKWFHAHIRGKIDGRKVQVAQAV